MILGWRCWYDDKRVFTSADTHYDDLPREGLLLVVEYEDGVNKRIVSNGDWYWMENGRWERVPCASEWDEWAAPPRVADYIKSGHRLFDIAYQRIQHMAMRSTWQ